MFTPRRIRLTRLAEQMPAEPLHIEVRESPVIDAETLAKRLLELMPRYGARNGW